MKVKKIEQIYYRTLRNCTFYMRENMPEHLHNEIGVLRGIIYCANEMGMNLHMDQDLIDFQMKKNMEDKK